MAGTIIADAVQAASTSQLVIENGVANTPPTIADVNGTAVGTFCRAWVNFNGTGTVAIRASFNVSSITDNGTGDYTVNFTNALPDANYATVTSGKSVDTNTSNADTYQPWSFVTSSVKIRSNSNISPYTAIDPVILQVAIFR